MFVDQSSRNTSEHRRCSTPTELDYVPVSVVTNVGPRPAGSISTPLIVPLWLLAK